MASIRQASKLLRSQTCRAFVNSRRNESDAAPAAFSSRSASPAQGQQTTQKRDFGAAVPKPDPAQKPNYLPKDPTPRMPQKSSYTKESCDARLAWVEESTNTSLKNIAGWWPEGCDHTTENLRGNIEQPIGLAKIPLAVAGPMLFNGAHAKDFILAPMATTEGALVASVSRGAKALTMSGGVKTWATQQRMTRAPMFYCGDPIQAVTVGEWVVANRERIQEEVVKRFSKRAVLREIIPAYDIDAVHTLLRFETGDAAGQNMTTVCSHQVAHWVGTTAPKELNVDIRFFNIEGNMSADKKCSALNALLGRGISVSAVAEIPEAVLQNVLGIDSETLLEANFYIPRISERIGQQAGFNVNTANVLGAMFTALGQDIACVHESAISRLDVTRLGDNGGVRASMYLPSLVVGTVGGGTKLPTQRECLEMIDCFGVGKVRKLAEIIAGYCLALDMSTYSAVVIGHFADAHDRLGRNRPEEK